MRIFKQWHHSSPFLAERCHPHVTLDQASRICPSPHKNSRGQRHGLHKGRIKERRRPAGRSRRMYLQLDAATRSNAQRVVREKACVREAPGRDLYGSFIILRPLSSRIPMRLGRNDPSGRPMNGRGYPRPFLSARGGAIPPGVCRDFGADRQQTSRHGSVLS